LPELFFEAGNKMEHPFSKNFKKNAQKIKEKIIGNFIVNVVASNGLKCPEMPCQLAMLRLHCYWFSTAY
jgi:hypothetical protein